MRHVQYIDRDSEEFKKRFYRSRLQPLLAYIGIIGCSLFILFNGWETFVLIARRRITAKEAAIQLISSYLGLILFVAFYVGYKFYYGTKIQSYANFDGLYEPMQRMNTPEDLDEKVQTKRSLAMRFWSWVK
jgi:amino acid permease